MARRAPRAGGAFGIREHAMAAALNDRSAVAYPRLRAREIRRWIERNLVRCIELTLGQYQVRCAEVVPDTSRRNTAQCGWGSQSEVGGSVNKALVGG
jgi:hypothetical protein